ncbi:MAG: protein-glutamate O-methyltransferase [Pseudomonadota bacterium]|nr:protein-glutamate O-methyltransferase [Pseudomonadota bacterium]
MRQQAQNGPQAPNPEFALQGPVLTEDAFRRLSAIAMREAGLCIADNKSDMVRTRLARRLRHLGLPDYESYCAFVERPEGGQELGQLISALTTNVSHFFREGHHFDVLANEVAPALKSKAQNGLPTRVWSAGCANGQEPYSIAMVLSQNGLSPDVGLRILATDIDPTVVAFAKKGRYPDHMLGGLSPEYRAKFLAPVDGEQFQVAETLQTYVTFRVLNLLKPWPMSGQFDAVFCRNVVIYFDKETQAALWVRFAEKINPGGWLFLGHSERISPEAERYFTKASVTAYCRTDTPVSNARKAN